MNWEKLLSHTRLGQENISSGKQNVRTGFQVDYDRVVFSPAFRRLQNKTQVFPLPKSDFVRNRLTHSLETASVGRSLGNLAGELILRKNPILAEKFSFSDFGALVSAACLAHDIGNPPFGHAGEDAISKYFRSAESEKFLNDLNPVEKADLQNFEGNAAGFRILSHTPPSQSQIQGGLGLCYSTYASFVKYPRPSFPDLKSTGKAILKKYNFFQSETEIYQNIAYTLGINKREYNGHQVHDRFPLAFLVEASDDICYTIIDYEDGYQMGLIPFDEIEGIFLKIIGDKNFNHERYSKLLAKDVKISYLRSKAMNALILDAATTFAHHENAILTGSFEQSLMDIIPQNEYISYIKDASYQNIYTADYILKIEAAGYKVLPGLLDFFIHSIFDRSDKFQKGLQKLIPGEYLNVDRSLFKDDYTNLLNITMYVASMTDQHAIELYRHINGISLSGF